MCGEPEHEHRADDHDPVDRVRPRHQRRVQQRRHLRDHLDPEEDREHEDRHLENQNRVVTHAATPSFFGDAGAGGDLVDQSSASSPSGREVQEQRLDVARIERRGVVRHRRRRIRQADERHAVAPDDLTRASSTRSCRPGTVRDRRRPTTSTRFPDPAAEHRADVPAGHAALSGQRPGGPPRARLGGPERQLRGSGRGRRRLRLHRVPRRHPDRVHRRVGARQPPDSRNPEGTGTPVEAGASLVLNIHYHPTGNTTELDQTRSASSGRPRSPSSTPPGTSSTAVRGYVQPGPNDDGRAEFRIPADVPEHLDDPDEDLQRCCSRTT